jgi:hypothetical protein
LLAEELTKALPANGGWTISDLGQSISPLPGSSLLISAKENCVYKVVDKEVGFPFGSFAVQDSHYYRIDLSYLAEFNARPGLIVASNSQKCLLSAKLFHSKSETVICEWKPGDPHTTRLLLSENKLRYQRPDGVSVVCSKVMVPIVDPLCHEIMARKVYNTLVNFSITGATQQDH